MNTRSRAWSSILVIVVCIGLAGGMGLYIREARSWKCPCFASAAMVRLTGVTITTYVQTWIAWTYILLASNFAALNAQISGGTMVNQESDSYQTQVMARVNANSMAFRQGLAATESPDHKFQATLASVGGGAAATTHSTAEAIDRENINWLRGLTEESAGTTVVNAQATLARNLEEYCSEADELLEICDITDDELASANERAETIFNYSVLSERLRDAGIDFCRTLVGFNPQYAISNLSSPEDLLVANARETRDARMSLALKACGQIIALRADIPDSEMAEWAERMRRLISGVENGVPTGLSPIPQDALGTSLYEIMSFAAQYRSANEEWFAHTATLPDATAVLKQVVAIQATKMFLRSHRYKMKHYIAAMIATIQMMESELIYQQKNGDVEPARF